MAKRHRSKRGIPCGNVVTSRLAERFGEGEAEIVGAACKLLIYLSPAQTARNRRDFDRFCQRTGMRWNIRDAARCAIEVTIDIAYVPELAHAEWCAFVENVLDTAVPLASRGSGELSESAARHAKLNRHQQTHGTERHAFGVDRAPQNAVAAPWPDAPFVPESPKPAQPLDVGRVSTRETSLVELSASALSAGFYYLHELALNHRRAVADTARIATDESERTARGSGDCRPVGAISRTVQRVDPSAIASVRDFERRMRWWRATRSAIASRRV